MARDLGDPFGEKSLDDYDNLEEALNDLGLNYEDVHEEPPREPEPGEFIDEDSSDEEN